MQIVINIDEVIYKRILPYRDFPVISSLANDFPEIIHAIANGVPIPKGHGRLMDYGYVVDAIDDWVNAGEYNCTNATDYLRNRIRNAPTIIEADEVEE